MCPTLGLPLGGLSSLLSPELLLACVVLLPAWVLLSPSPSWFLFMNLFCILLMTHLGYLHLTKVFLKCYNSLRSCGTVHSFGPVGKCTYDTVLERLWWLAHCRYLSVWVGFWYIVIRSELSALGWTKVSRTGIAPLAWLPSTANFIAASTLFILSRNNCLWACCWMTEVSSTNLHQNLGGWRQTWGFPFQNAPCTGWQL